MEDNNFQEQYMNCLREVIKEQCSDGWYDIYWDYEDEKEFRRELPALLADYNPNDYDNVVDYLTDRVDEMWTDGGVYPEGDLRTAVGDKIRHMEDNELANYINDKLNSDDFFDDLQEAGYKGINYGVAELLNKSKIDVDITLAPYNEQNYDMGSIISCFGSDYLTPDLGYIDESYLDNSITYLLHQQGHTVKELYDCLYGKGSNSKLVQSVAEEINNNPAEATCGLVVLVSVPGDVFVKLLSDKSGYAEVPVGTTMGLYNSWIGGGSLLEIELEKPFVFSLGDTLSVKSANQSSQGDYSIADCYDYIERDEGIKFVGQPSLVKEDLAETLEYVINTYGENDEEE